MGKAREPQRREPRAGDEREFERVVVPMVDYSETPRIRIYDGADDGSYWFRRAGFTHKLTDP